jgi:hypothetical protein
MTLPKSNTMLLPNQIQPSHAKSQRNATNFRSNIAVVYTKEKAKLLQAKEILKEKSLMPPRKGDRPEQRRCGTG